MFDVPVDSWYVWVGLALASTVLVGTVGSLPSAPPPDATGAVETVDRIASAEYDATGEHPLDATQVRLGPRQLGLRNDAGTTHAAFAFGPVTPVGTDARLQSLLYGAPPDRAFESPARFRRAVRRAQERDPRWEPADRTLVVRHVSWRGEEVTLVDV